MTAPTIALWLPELAELAQQPEALQQHAPTLLKLAAYGRSPSVDFDWLPLLDQQAPLAAYARHYDNGDAGQRYWMRADPVVMHPDISRVHLLAVNDHDLSTAQADQLLETLGELFVDDGFELSRGEHEAAVERWYIASDQRLPQGFASPDSALGNPLEDFLRINRQSPGSNIWQRLQSETQMQLHQHPVNIERQQAGLSALNSLWFWGAGKLPDQLPGNRPDRVLSMSVELAGWCRWAQVEFTSQQPGESIRHWIKQAVSKDNLIMIEWRVQRRFSLEQNLINLDALIDDLSQRHVSINLYQHVDKVHQLNKPNIMQRWLGSNKKIMARGMQAITQLSQRG